MGIIQSGMRPNSEILSSIQSLGWELRVWGSLISQWPSVASDWSSFKVSYFLKNASRVEPRELWWRPSRFLGLFWKVFDQRTWSSDLGSEETTRWRTSSVRHIWNVFVNHSDSREVWHGFQTSKIEWHDYKKRKELDENKGKLGWPFIGVFIALQGCDPIWGRSDSRKYSRRPVRPAFIAYLRNKYFEIKRNRKASLNKNGSKPIISPNKIKKEREKVFEFGGHLRKWLRNRLLHRLFRVRSGCFVLDFCLEVILHPLPGVAVLLLLLVLALGWDHLDRSIHGTRNLTSSMKIHPQHGWDLSHAVEVPSLPLKGVTFHCSHLLFHTSSSGLERLPFEAQTFPLIAQTTMFVDDLAQESFSMRRKERFLRERRINHYLIHEVLRLFLILRRKMEGGVRKENAGRFETVTG